MNLPEPVKARWTCPSFPGETHPCATLTNEQVREIFKLRMQVEQPMLARRYKTQQSTISRIWHRKAWKSVTENL